MALWQLHENGFQACNWTKTHTHTVNVPCKRVLRIYPTEIDWIENLVTCSWLWKAERENHWHSCGAKTGLLFQFLTPCFVFFSIFFFLFTVFGKKKKKKKLTWGIQVDSAPFSAEEKIYFVVCGNLYRNLCLFLLLLFFCLVNYYYFMDKVGFFFSSFMLILFIMSAVHCTKFILVFRLRL